MKTKYYTTAEYMAMVSPSQSEVLDLAHRRQANLYVAAPTGKVARERMKALGFHDRVRIASGDQLDALVAAGAMHDDGSLVLVGDGGYPVTVARVYADDLGNQYCTRAGRLDRPITFVKESE